MQITVVPFTFSNFKAINYYDPMIQVTMHIFFTYIIIIILSKMHKLHYNTESYALISMWNYNNTWPHQPACCCYIHTHCHLSRLHSDIPDGITLIYFLLCMTIGIPLPYMNILLISWPGVCTLTLLMAGHFLFMRMSATLAVLYPLCQQLLSWFVFCLIAVFRSRKE